MWKVWVFLRFEACSSVGWLGDFAWRFCIGGDFSLGLAWWVTLCRRVVGQQDGDGFLYCALGGCSWLDFGWRNFAWVWVCFLIFVPVWLGLTLPRYGELRKVILLSGFVFQSALLSMLLAAAAAAACLIVGL